MKFAAHLTGPELIPALLALQLPGSDSFKSGVVKMQTDFDERMFTDLFARAYRVGKATLKSVTDRPFVVQALGASCSIAHWRADQLYRVALLATADTHLDPQALRRLVQECYFSGDNAEREAVLMGLPFLREGESYLALAVEACRSSVQSVFEAISSENPYPGAYFPEPNFNQMVLKALFTGVELRRICGLPQRLTGDLIRMAEDYASERKAAGRDVPADIEWLKEKGRFV